MSENKEFIDKLFPLVSDNNNDNNKRVRRLYTKIYSAENGELLLKARGELRRYPNPEQIPSSCGFGKLLFNVKNESWACSCFAFDYFGGEFCDELSDKLTKENKCLKVGHVDNLENTDVSTFNPFLEGICVECATKNATPIVNATIPKCKVINDNDDDDDDDEPKRRSHCFSDALNPNNNSIFNKYVPGYGCVCDYYNGFVEVRLNNYSKMKLSDNKDVDEETKEKEVSHACIKIGQRNSDFHKAHLAYHTFKNLGKPIQVHQYNALEAPFDSLFKSSSSILVDQPAIDVVHEYDWLNRCVKPNSSQKIRRLNYPTSDWPVVHKNHLVNSYERRKETFPISALKIATGRGFETKHWYETTNMRYISNSIWGHPIMYGYKSPDGKYDRKCILNPLGAKHGTYYGLTLLHKPGDVVRIDTRGYEQEPKAKRRKIVTIPPDYMNELMDKNDYIYIPMLFNSYTVKN